DLLLLGKDAHLAAIFAEARILDGPVDEREQGEVATHADIFAGMDAGTDLTHQDVPRLRRLAAEDLDAAALRIAVAPVARAALSLFMSHRSRSCFDAGDPQRRLILAGALPAGGALAPI